MAAGRIEILGGDVFCSIAGGGREARFPLDEATPKLTDWAQRYDKASERDANDALAAIGREMFDWLDGSGWASAWADALGDDRILEIKVGARPGPNETALLDAPWELLARADGPIASDALQLFVVARRIGDAATPLAPRHADLQLMFMAAAPESQHELDFEAEEAAILQATQRLPLRLVVEETGNRTFLGERLNSDEGPFEALHLSCHGDIDKQAGPVLLLEFRRGRRRQDRSGGAGRGARGQCAGIGVPLRLPDGGIRPGGRSASRRRARRRGAPRCGRGPACAPNGGAVRPPIGRTHPQCGRLGRLGLRRGSARLRHRLLSRARQPLGHPPRSGGRAARTPKDERQKPRAWPALASGPRLSGSAGRWGALRRGQAAPAMGRPESRESLSRQGQAARAGGDARRIRWPQTVDPGGFAGVPR